MKKNNSPLVSIITPTYNSEKFISKTIISILNQTYTNWELLITDDCSDDSTIKVINSYVKNEKRIKLFILKNNSGAGVARNNSIFHSQGKYIAFCDADDQWLPNKLKTQIDFMNKNNLQFTYSSYNICNENDDLIGKVISPKVISYRKMLNNNYVGCLTAIYDAEKIGKLYMSKIRNRQDWTLWFKILKKTGPTKGIVEPLAIYRNRRTSISSSKMKQLKYNWMVYNKELGYNIILSTLLMINFLIYYAAKKI